MRARLTSLLARLRELARRGRLERERDDEFRFHLEMQTEYNRRQGMSEDDARRSALLAFGGVQRFREEVRDARGVVALDNLLRDARFSVRRLRRSAGFSLGVIITLGVGVGAAVAIGTLVDGILLRPLPYAEPEQLVRVGLVTPGIPSTGDEHSEATFAHFREGMASLDGIGAYYTNDGINVTDGDEARRVTAAMITPGALALLRVRASHGRVLTEADAENGSLIPVMISHDLWRQRYAGNPAIIGGTIELNRSLRQVVGVMPPGFDFPAPQVKVWYPLSATVETASLANRYLNVIGRLKYGVSVDMANAEMQRLLPSLSERFPAVTAAEIKRSGAQPRVVALREHLIAPVRGHLQLLGLMVAVVLLIALANVANLFLLRTERLRAEIAISMALGASRSALARRFTIEGLVIGAASIAVALPMAAIAVSTRFGFHERDLPRLHEVSFEPRSVMALVIGSLMLGAVIGLAAFLRTQAPRFGDNLRVTTRTVAGGAWRRLQQGLVAAQMALALTLILGASLMGRSLWNLRHAEVGFRVDHGAAFEVSLPYRGYESYGNAAAFHAEVLERLRQMPGNRGAEATMRLPLTDLGGPGTALRLTSPINGEVRGGDMNIATPSYFQLMGIPLLSGRTFAPGDLRAEHPAIVISASLARALFAGADATGRQVAVARSGRPENYRIVGVVGDVHGSRIEEGFINSVYFPLLADGDGVPGDSIRIPITPRWVQYVIRSEVPVATQAGAIRALIREIDPRVPVTNMTSLPGIVDAATARVRLTVLLLAVSAATALLLGVVGVYSVVSYAVAGRHREFGVRLALGASPSRILRLVLREGATLAAIGIAIGVVAALATARFARSMLYEVSPTEPVIYLLGTLLLLAVATGATLLPARQAARVDPAEVLRGE